MIRDLGKLLDRVRPPPAAPDPERLIQIGGVALRSGFVRMRLKSVHGDHLVCRKWNGTTEGDTDILVAKPFFLRQTGWDGKTRNGFSYVSYGANGTTRVSVRMSDGGSENQVVLPDYIPAGAGWDGDEIIAAARDTGMTISGTRVVYEDTNRDARAWHKVPS